VTLRQVTRLVPAKGGSTRQIHALTPREDLPPWEVCWRLSWRWREENYFRHARTRFALDALDSYAAAPDDPARMVPDPGRPRSHASGRPEPPPRRPRRPGTPRCSSCAVPPPAAYLTSQVINALDAPMETAYLELEHAEDTAATIPARVPLGTLRPGHGPAGRRDQADHPRHPDGRIQHRNCPGPRPARALRPPATRPTRSSARPLAPPATSAPADGELLIRLDPLTAPRRTQAVAALCEQLTAIGARYPGTDLVLRYEVKSHPNPA
jgi:hypothetical protein